MSLLEFHYRNVLRMLPASYRAEREEEMVAAYLEYAGDVPDEANPKPRWGEVFSVVGLAIRVRLAGTSGPPTYFAWGETVRMIALLGLALQAVLSAPALPLLPAMSENEQFFGAAWSADRLFNIGEVLLGNLWLVAFVALARGAGRTAKTAAVLAFGWSFLVPVVSGGWPTMETWSVGFVVLSAVPVLALLLGHHRDAPPPRRSWWAALLPPAAAAAALYAVNHYVTDRVAAGDTTTVETLSAWAYGPGGIVIALVVAAVAALTLGASGPTLLALAFYTIATLLDRLPDLYHYHDEVAEYWQVAALQSWVLGGLTLILAVVGVWRLPIHRRLQERSV
ncbi:hypothetical protein ACIBEJ_21195 [Nonomuraea sp. NPDC050790]|uniref:hypothetical protein n=1 Tax=Nonomuraea sp. NPDC050790 TaxID=3364371 RepID=UPI00378B7A33